MRTLVLVLVLLSACGGAAPLPTGGVTGTVVGAPCRPVERVGDPPCPPAAGVTVLAGGAQAVTDANGVYALRLPPGTYTVRVRAGAREVPAQPPSVTVVAGSTTTANLTFDSGIR